MAYTYADDPDSDGTAAQQRDAVRVLIQDTKKADGTDGGKLLTDAQIAFFLAEEMNVYTAAAACCDSLVAAGGSVRNRTVGDVSITYDVAFYRELGRSLRARGSTYQALYAGGISQADKDATKDETDRVPPAFARGMQEHPGTDGQPSVLETEQL